MDLQKMINSAIEKKLNDGFLKEKIDEVVEKLIDEIVTETIGGYYGVGAKIKLKLREQMNTKIETYNFDDYLPKLELVLNDIITGVTGNTKKSLEIFREYFNNIEKLEEISLSDIFNRYLEFVSKNVETTNLEIVQDDHVYYQNVNVAIEVEKALYGRRTIVKFYCNEDLSLNKELQLFEMRTGYKDGIYADYKTNNNRSVRFLDMRDLDEFDVFLIRLTQDFTQVKVDVSGIKEVEVEVEAEPEINWS